MARDQGKSNIIKIRRQPPPSLALGKQPQFTNKQQAVRKSARLQVIKNVRERFKPQSDLIPMVQALPSPQTSNISEGKSVCEHPQILHKPLRGPQERKRKHGQQLGHSSPQDEDRPASRRPRTSPSSCIAEEIATSDNIEDTTDPIQCWIRTGRWPKRHFEQDSQVREDLEHEGWLEGQIEESNQVVQYVEIKGGRHPRPIKKIPTLPRWKQSDSSLTGSSDEEKKESKSAAYRDIRYTMLLAAKESFMDNPDLDITDVSESLCRRPLD